MDRIAILRFLLAVLYWCRGNPPDKQDENMYELFTTDLFSKLDLNSDCFELLGDEKRFYQYRKPDDKNEKLSANYLIQEVPTGTNKWHFRHSTDKVNGLCPACCAMGLLRLPMFATSGGRGKPPGVNAKPPIYTIPMGVSLEETLQLSWRQVALIGTPAWEKPNMQLPVKGEISLLMGLTWLPRRVWLGSPEAPIDACISCGRKEHLIRNTVFAPIGSVKTKEGDPGRIWNDPHVVYSTSAIVDVTSLHAGNALGNTDSAAGQWAKIIAEMLKSGAVGSIDKRIWVVGFSTINNDKYLEAKEFTFSIHCPMDQIRESIEKIEQWQKEGTNLARKIRPQNEKGSSRKHVEIPSMLAAIRPHVENKASIKVGKLTPGTEETWEQLAREYSPMIKMIAKSLSPGFTVSAVRRRQQISRAIPDMRLMKKEAKKATRKKGDDK
jgi:hypothetical protein